jgi:hypothetical protein
MAAWTSPTLQPRFLREDHGQIYLTGQNPGRVFNYRRSRASKHNAITLKTKTAQLKVENSAQTTFRLSPVSFRAHRGNSIVYDMTQFFKLKTIGRPSADAIKLYDPKIS